MLAVEVAAVIPLVSLAFGVAKAEETHEDFHFGWAPFLFIRKVLHAIHKLSKYDMEDFLSMVSACQLYLNE